MKKNIKGFTLVELLAVIVVIALLATIGGSYLLSVRNKSNKDLAIKLEDSITKLGESIYSYEYIVGRNSSSAGTFYTEYKRISSNESIKVDLCELYDKGYMENVNKTTIDTDIGTTEDEGSTEICTLNSPENGKTCSAFLLVTKTDNGPEFKGYIDCGSLYKTSDYDVVGGKSVTLTSVDK